MLLDKRKKHETGIEPATFALARRRSTTEPLVRKIYNCLRPESNWRHMDFQSIALPTELPRLVPCGTDPTDSMDILHFIDCFVNNFLGLHLILHLISLLYLDSASASSALIQSPFIAVQGYHHYYKLSCRDRRKDPVKPEKHRQQDKQGSA